MSISHLFRKSALGRRTTHLAIVVFPDEGSVFQAYRLLHYHGISPENLAIVGQGYSSPERVGLMTPLRIILYKAVIYGLVSSVVGAVLGAGSVLIWKLQQDLSLILPACALVSGLAGVVLGALFGLFGEGTTASIYRHHLRQGRYLLMMEGSENLVRWGQEVLGCYSAPSPH
ncbi:hypothetical protein OsccyDRAFT_2953 [Leptolyngbyaceae cyanobacterium JSC-12]|nr:hypothetical protein OsccyDRAFT_2953 [Leptolyngbyaceae cyanobacterium JSC-12]